MEKNREDLKGNKMEEIVVATLATCIVLIVISLAWKAFHWVWWKPMKLQRLLSDQGIRGSPYKFLHGNLKENMAATKEARSKPLELSHRVVAFVMPLVDQTVRKYGKLCVIWYGPTPSVQVMDPDLVKEILSNKTGSFTKTRRTPVGRFLVDGLVNHDGEKWIKHRKIISPAFHLEKIKVMLPEFYTSCSQMVNRWQRLVSEDSSELDVWPEIQNLTADIISRAAFGSSYEEGRRIFELQTEQAELVIKTAQSIYIPGSSILPTKSNRRMKEIYREVRTLLSSMIQKREKLMKNGETNVNDLLGLLMESNFKEIQDNKKSKKVGLTTDEVIEECKLFYFGGQETTSTALVWTMIVLSMHPEWQAQAREEVLQVFGKQKPDFDGLNNLKIVTMILYEVLRLYPSGVMIIRAIDKTTKLGEVYLPAGVQVTIPIFLIHRDPGLWGNDAEEFNPNRFSDGISKATKNQTSFLPFGGGPRICIGQNFAMIEAKMALSMILQHFSFELSPTYVHAPHTIITLQPQHGAQLILHKLCSIFCIYLYVNLWKDFYRNHMDKSSIERDGQETRYSYCYFHHQ